MLLRNVIRQSDTFCGYRCLTWFSLNDFTQKRDSSIGHILWIQIFDLVFRNYFPRERFGKVGAADPVENVEDDEGSGEKDAGEVVDESDAPISAELSAGLVQMVSDVAGAVGPEKKVM